MGSGQGTLSYPKQTPKPPELTNLPTARRRLGSTSVGLLYWHSQMATLSHPQELYLSTRMAETFIICLTLKNERLDCSAYAIFCRAGGLLFAQAAELKFELLSGVKSRSLQVSVESDRHVSKPLNPPRMNNSRQAPARRSDPLPLLPSPCGTSNKSQTCAERQHKMGRSDTHAHTTCTAQQFHVATCNCASHTTLSIVNERRPHTHHCGAWLA